MTIAILIYAHDLHHGAADGGKDAAETEGDGEEPPEEKLE